jgi:hypothetical protein
MKEWPIRCPCCGIVQFVHDTHPLYGIDAEQLDLFTLRLHLASEVYDEEAEDDGQAPQEASEPRRYE